MAKETHPPKAEIRHCPYCGTLATMCIDTALPPPIRSPILQGPGREMARQLLGEGQVRRRWRLAHRPAVCEDCIKADAALFFVCQEIEGGTP